MASPMPPKVDRERPLTLESIRGVHVGTPGSAPHGARKWLGRIWSYALGKPKQAENAEAVRRISNVPLARLKPEASNYNFRCSKQGPGGENTPQLHLEDGKISLIVKRQELLSEMGSGHELIGRLQNEPETLAAFNVWMEQNPTAKENSEFILKVIGAFKGGDVGIAGKEGEPFSAFSETTQNLISKAKINVSRGNYKAIYEVVEKLKQLDLSVLKEIYREHIDQSSTNQINVGGPMYSLSKNAYDQSSPQELAEGIAICLFEVASMVSGNLRQTKLKG